MALHGLGSITVGVPDPPGAVAFYEQFGLESLGGGELATTDGGCQLRLVAASRRRLEELELVADDPDDVARLAAQLRGLGSGVRPAADGMSLEAAEPVCGVRVRVVVAPRLRPPERELPGYNGPGRRARPDGRSSAVVRRGRVRPRRLGHVVLATTDLAASRRFFVEGLGFKVSDRIGDDGVFLRCSADHHNLLLLNSPAVFLHHSSWEVDDVDEVGRGAMSMLEDHPERHVWGLGRHYAGSNFFWYLKDPAGNFAEYFSDMDVVPEDFAWTPEVLDGARGFFNWGPQPPPSFLEPEDLAALMTANHGARA